jgi:hypothetical protein
MRVIWYGIAMVADGHAWGGGWTARWAGSRSMKSSLMSSSTMQWNGTAWRQVPAPRIPGGGSLASVTASARASALAVAHAGRISSVKPRTLILH